MKKKCMILAWATVALGILALAISVYLPAQIGQAWYAHMWKNAGNSLGAFVSMLIAQMPYYVRLVTGFMIQTNLIIFWLMGICLAFIGIYGLVVTEKIFEA